MKKEWLIGVAIGMAWTGFAAEALAVAGSPFTTLDLPRYTGEVFPKAKQAVYVDAFVPLQTVTIVPGMGIPASDLQLKLLVDKLSGWNGGRVVVAPAAPAQGAVVFLDVAGEGKPAPEKPEGYALTCYKKDGRDAVAITSHDRLGRLWGIVSLLQLVRREGGAVALRGAEIADWPDHPARGCLSNEFPGRDEAVMIFTKANTFVFQIRPPAGYAYWQTFLQHGPQTIGPEIARLAPLFNGLGLNVYFSINPSAGEPKISATDREAGMLADWMSQVAALGAGVYWAYDDTRFPVPKADLEKFGSAAETDAYLVPKVFKAVRARHPDFKMVFCPPFYWGPTTPHPYPEDREVYLSRIGEAFDPAIGIFWTGPRVQSSTITPEETAWFTNRVQRKPWLFQNRGWLPHKYDRSYVTDRITAWQDWRYEGFWNDMAVSLLNLHASQNLMSLASLSDYLWNTAAYDAERSVRAAVGATYGSEAFPLLDELNRALTVFDQHTKVTPAAVKALPEIERQWAAVTAIWARVQNEAPYPPAISNLTVFASSIGLTARFVNTDLKAAAAKGFAQFDEWDKAVKEKAVAESGLTDTDLLITPSQLAGGNGYVIYGSRCEPRFAVWINGRQGPFHTMRTAFESRPFPPSRDYELIVAGQQDAAGDDVRCAIRISVNGTVIHEGRAEFPRFGWGVTRYTIPASAMKHNNSLVFENLDDGTTRAPWFMINYAILRK